VRTLTGAIRAPPRALLSQGGQGIYAPGGTVTVLSTALDPGALSAEVARLRALVDGWVSVPGEERYSAATLTFNGSLDRSPVVAASCGSAQDVRRAVEAAAGLGLPVSVRGGGHSVAGDGVGDGSLLVDLSPLRGVTVDPVARRARVAGGSLWNDVDPATKAHGLAVPGGTFGDTGVGGLTLGGGIGWLIGVGA
jgi:FAD/FMN-containing dehydrogenase